MRPPVLPLAATHAAAGASGEAGASLARAEAGREREFEEGLKRVSREGGERVSPDPLVTHRQQPGYEGDEQWHSVSTPRSSSGASAQDVTISNLASGGRVANMSVATDESPIIDRNGTGERIDRTEWHRVVTFQGGLVDMLEKHAKKGRLVYVAGKLQTRKWRKDGEDSDRYSTEILLVPGSRIQFLERPAAANGGAASLPNGDTTVPVEAASDTADPASPIPF